ncbi:MAG: HEAT repeat domain-containing protein [Bdellovibrionota bacterium]
MDDLETSSKKLPAFRKPETSGSSQKTFKSLAILFVLVCCVFVVIFWSIGWIAHEDLSPGDLYARTLDGRADSKRMASLEWARRLHLFESREQNQDKLRLAPDAAQTKRFSEIIKQAIAGKGTSQEAPDATYLGGLATVIGFSRFPTSAHQELSEIFVATPVREWVEVQIPVILALTRLQMPLAPNAEAHLLEALGEEDPALRKVAVFAVGVLAQSSESRAFFRPKLLEIRSDSVSDVRWNAGFALGRWQDPEAEPVLKELLDLASRVRRDATIEGEGDEVLTESLLLSIEQAFRLIAQRPAGPLKEKLAVIAHEHPHLKLRQAAISALQLR